MEQFLKTVAACEINVFQGLVIILLAVLAFMARQIAHLSQSSSAMAKESAETTRHSMSVTADTSKHSMTVQAELMKLNMNFRLEVLKMQHEQTMALAKLGGDTTPVLDSIRRLREELKAEPSIVPPPVGSRTPTDEQVNQASKS